MPLTDTAIRAAKARPKPYKISDASGLYLLVNPNGRRYWRFQYRYRGSRKLLALGVYPDVSLADARAARDAARRLVANGQDPAYLRKLEKLKEATSTGNTFRLIADEWLAKQEREGRAAATLKKTKWLLEFAYPFIGDRPICEISAPEVLLVLRKVEARGRYETARRLRSTCGIVFRYAVATARAETDPTFALQGALTSPKVRHRAAIIDPKGVSALLRAIDGFEGQVTTQTALRLAPHVFVRPGELRTAEWSEFDLGQAMWTIPATKTKMRRVQKVPLSCQALQMLVDLRKITGNGPLVFPGIGNRRRPLSENTLNAALRRLGYDKTEMTTHGFRAMAASLLNEMGIWNPDAIERQLGHIEGNDVRRAYARAEFWDERVKMMQHWSDYLDSLRAGLE